MSRGSKMRVSRWTPTEDAALRRAWDGGTLLNVLAALPGRSKWAIWRRVHALGLKQHRPKWTPAQDDKLRELWSMADDIREIAEALERPVSGVYERAQRIGLPLGCPPGFEYLTHAARRAGVSVATLRRILAANEAPIYKAVTKPRKSSRKPRPGVMGRARRLVRHIVEAVDVDEAMARWNESETAAGAARRLGVCAWTLTRKLKAAGHGADRTHKRQHIRVTERDLQEIGVLPWGS